MNEACLGLGANIAPRKTYLKSAIAGVAALGKIEKIAPLYKSEAYGVTGQPWFLNTALLLRTELSPHDLLRALKDCERSVGRRKRFRWGPREIDIDILLYNQEIINEPALQIPHADLANRRFVLQPLADLNPGLVVPGLQKTVENLLLECPDRSRIAPYDTETFLHGINV